MSESEPATPPEHPPSPWGPAARSESRADESPGPAADPVPGVPKSPGPPPSPVHGTAVPLTGANAPRVDSRSPLYPGPALAAPPPAASGQGFPARSGQPAAQPPAHGAAQSAPAQPPQPAPTQPPQPAPTQPAAGQPAPAPIIGWPAALAQPTATPPTATPPTATPPTATPPTATPSTAMPPTATHATAAHSAFAPTAAEAASAQFGPGLGGGAAVATAEVTASTVALPNQRRAPGPAAAPATAAPVSPPAGTVWRSENSRRARRRDLSRRLPALHIGWHLTTAQTLHELRTEAPGSGLILGMDRQREPVTVRFFRPEPTTVTLVGGVWAQRLLAFRALSLGARVVVMTGQPASWQGFGELATGRADRMLVWTDPRPPEVPASASQPLLVVYDQDARFGELPVPAAWQTQLVTVPRLVPENAQLLADANLVMLQRLTAAEAGVAVPALGLPVQSGELLQAMTDDMLALLGGGADRYTWLSPTAIEVQFHGAPRR